MTYEKKYPSHIAQEIRDVYEIGNCSLSVVNVHLTGGVSILFIASWKTTSSERGFFTINEDMLRAATPGVRHA